MGQGPGREIFTKLYFSYSRLRQVAQHNDRRTDLKAQNTFSWTRQKFLYDSSTKSNKYHDLFKGVLCDATQSNMMIVTSLFQSNGNQ